MRCVLAIFLFALCFVLNIHTGKGTYTGISTAQQPQLRLAQRARLQSYRYAFLRYEVTEQYLEGEIRTRAYWGKREV